MYYTPETLLNHVFEDLRKTKAPSNKNLDLSVMIFELREIASEKILTERFFTKLTVSPR
jgi:hypothetical protein